jgi:hypothetical protein
MEGGEGAGGAHPSGRDERGQAALHRRATAEITPSDDLRTAAQNEEAAAPTRTTTCANKVRSEKADWSRAIRFLRSFGQRVPFETDPGATTGSHRGLPARG